MNLLKWNYMTTHNLSAVYNIKANMKRKQIKIIHYKQSWNNLKK